jgi:uncharacterized protein YbcC (UPF0753/DUF2309 family)
MTGPLERVGIAGGVPLRAKFLHLPARRLLLQVMAPPKTGRMKSKEHSLSHLYVG